MARPSINWSRLSVLAGLAGSFVIVSYLTLYWDSNPPALLLKSNEPNRIDFYAEQTHGVKYNDEGRLTQTFSSPQVTRYVRSGETVMKTPVLHMRSKDGDLWDGVAQKGVLIGENEVQLSGAVVITDQDKATQLHTEQLRYFTDRQEVTSDVAVLLRKGNDTTRGIGMRADLNSNRVELLHQVEGTYVQP